MGQSDNQKRRFRVAGYGRRLLGRLKSDRRGTTAVEFGLVAAPFFLLMLGIMTVGLHFFTITALEHAVASAARVIRTGEVQTSQLTVSGFKALVCSESGGLIPCNDDLVIHIKSGTSFADLTPATSCLTGSSLTTSSAKSADTVATYSGSSGNTVLITACYDWKLGAGLWQGLWNLMSVTPTNNGKTIISATTSFRSEPY